MAVCKKCKSWIVSGNTCWDCSQAKEPQMVKKPSGQYAGDITWNDIRIQTFAQRSTGRRAA